MRGPGKTQHWSIGAQRILRQAHLHSILYKGIEDVAGSDAEPVFPRSERKKVLHHRNRVGR